MFLYLTEVAVVITPHGFRPDTTHAVLLARPTPTSSRNVTIGSNNVTTPHGFSNARREHDVVAHPVST